ncbi:hypothetical protein CEUSTIGMA_g5961.t1 [Chlamydomonas eustigma]|uniref:Uncharacterized protein n=1 Tax=Chlamydomonas eustigma TaxID=1157962 RepID=A0A250X619_9CHLO|nr:hypothetical protein CEUSTIGMA_g5961.t1 [Chlamydomonas eustigma]|eukprot:GAX78521.1 hypothetical protein CEUSTIGMA_g5961.t1 [Chlamydomonas eustigma]
MNLQINEALRTGQSTRGDLRVIKYDVDGELRKTTSTATTFTELERDLRRVDLTLPNDFSIFVEVEPGLWESAISCGNVIPSTPTPVLSIRIRQKTKLVGGQGQMRKYVGPWG